VVKNKEVLMKKTLVFLCCVAILISACGSAKKATPVVDQVATQVSVVLTSMPSATQPPTQVVIATQTQPAATQTPAPTLSPTTAPSPTSVPTSTALPTIAATATISPEDPRLSLGKPTWERTKFEVGKDFYYDTTSPEFLVEAINGMLVMTGMKADGFHGWTLTYPRPQDFYLEATVKTGDCSGRDRYGLVLRGSDYTDTKGYFLGFSCDGQYDLRKLDVSQFSDVFTWKPAVGLLAGSNQTNRLGVMLKGNKFSFYANGKLIGEATDNTYMDAGYFGLYIAAVNTPGFNVQMSSIAYWDLK
jgi:hypothetical protein